MSDLVFEKDNLPKGWVSTPIGQIALLINGKAFKPENWSRIGLPIVRIQNLNDTNKLFNYCNFEVDEKFIINDDQLLFAWSGTPGTSFGCFIWNRGKAVLNQHIFKIEINQKYLDKRYLYYSINKNLDKYISKAHGTAGLAHITKGKFENELIILPPLNEQKRIVSKIESIFSQIDACKEKLENVKKLLKQNKQSILKSAFEGKLTKKWRLSNAFELHLDWFDYSNQRGKIENNSHKFLNDIITISDEHCWIDFNSIIDSMKNGIYKQKKFYSDKGIACLRMYNIENNKLVWKKIKRMILTSKEILEYQLLPNDILINRVNSLELVGKSALIPHDLENCIFESKNIRLRVKTKNMDPKYVYFWIIIGGRHYFYKNFQQTTGMASINQIQLGNLPIPYCIMDEQKEIVSQIEQGLSLIENTENMTNSMLYQLDTIRSAILKQAFEGKLVPQDPNDESASILLERIKKEKLLKIKKTD